MARVKDQVCSCTFTDNHNDYKNINENQLHSYIDAYKGFLDQKMDNSKKNKVLDNFRTECSLGACAQSPYKFYEQKLRINETPCNSIEKCLGDGYQIPSTTDNDTSVECNRFVNKNECIFPIVPNITSIVDPLNNECKNLVEGPKIQDIKLKPTECKLSGETVPSLKTDNDRINAAKFCEYIQDPRYPNDPTKKINMLKLTYNITIPSTPENDPTLCPPYKRDKDGNIKKDENGNNIRVNRQVWVNCPIVSSNTNSSKPPSKPSSTTNVTMIVGGIAFFIFLLIILIVIKKRRG